MSEIAPPPIPTDQRVHDIDLARDMAYAAKPHWDVAHDAMKVAEEAMTLVAENHADLGQVPATTKEEREPLSPEVGIGSERLRNWVRKYKFYTVGTLDNTNTPKDRVIDSAGGFGPLGHKSLGTIPSPIADFLSKTMRTNMGGQFENSRFNQQFVDQDITEKLTIQPAGKNPEQNLYGVLDPKSDKADERIVAIVYERTGIIDGFGRKTDYRFTLCMPQSEASVFSDAVTENPTLIREMVDIAMVEELALGDSWNGPNGTASPPRGSKLAIRTGFAQGPEESLIIPFEEAA